MTTAILTPAMGAPAVRVPVALGERSYHILIGTGLLSGDEAWAGLPAARHALIVTNDAVGPLYAPSLSTRLAPHYREVHVLSLPDGEAFKAEGNVATLLTKRRAIGFSAATGKWTYVERFQPR